MLIVDTHCHALQHWFEPIEVLPHQMHVNGVEKAVLIQVRGQFDNRYILECTRRFPGRFSSVVLVHTDIPPFIAMAYDAFGASRLMWDSAFPPVAGREDDP